MISGVPSICWTEDKQIPAPHSSAVRTRQVCSSPARDGNDADCRTIQCSKRGQTEHLRGLMVHPLALQRAEGYLHRRVIVSVVVRID